MSGLTAALLCAPWNAAAATEPMPAPRVPDVALPASPLPGAGPTALDTQITRELESTFRLTGWVDATHLSVATQDGVVDLSGRAANATERALAIELARNLRGVRMVTTARLEP